MSSQFEHIRQAITERPVYPGYPTERLVLAEEDVAQLEGIVLPEGPWQVHDTDHPSDEETQNYRTAGYIIDAQGRPLHPHFAAMATDPEVGVVTGKGRYWNWGPNYTADPIVITTDAQPRVLLIKRGDTGAWALPGGFVDPEDSSPADAAKRELLEEASFHTTLEPIEVYAGVVGDTRTTAHAWAETSAYLFTIDAPVPVTGGDDATEARWVRLDRLSDTLFGSHAYLISKALETIPLSSDSTVQSVLKAPKQEVATEVLQAGHMAYDHVLISHKDTTLFVKEHVPERFDDPARELHSRQYLQKEAEIYEHLVQRGFASLPELVELQDDTLLAMNALLERDGWKWRAPKGEEDAYICAVLAALNELGSMTAPLSPSYAQSIESSHTTFWKEGWDSITDETALQIAHRIEDLTADWTDTQRARASQLSVELPVLRERSKSITRTPPLVMAHNDARQSNIAWHPVHGVRLVDWSWGDEAPEHADSTMFLIDMVKSGYDVSAHTEHINRDQLIVLIGFWLAHSIWTTRDGSMVVREQQVASAVAAYQLLEILDSSK